MSKMKSISRKTEWVSFNAWRGRSRPINAVCGANDTGTWADSPCPSHVCIREIGMVKAALRKAGIKCAVVHGQTSNVFCVARYVIVAPEDRAAAIAVIEPLIDEAQLLYLEDHEVDAKNKEVTQ